MVLVQIPFASIEKYTHKIEEEDTHKMEVAELKKLKQYFAEGKNSVKIVIAGKMGTGKTTLVNSLCGKQLAVEGHIAFSETTKFVSYTIAVDIPSEILEKTINVRVWDTPGLGDPFFDDEATAKEIAEKCQEADLLIYCLDIRGRFANDDATEIKLLTEALGQQMWKHAVFALTFANAVGANYGCVAVTELRKRIGSWTDAITHLMKEKLKFPHDIVDNISIIPAGYRHYQPPGIDDWFSLFWAASFTKTKPSAQSALLGITIRRLESALKTDQGGASEEMPIRLSVGALVGLVAGAAMPGPVGAAVGGAAGSGVGYVGKVILESIIYSKYSV